MFQRPLQIPERHLPVLLGVVPRFLGVVVVIGQPHFGAANYLGKLPRDRVVVFGDVGLPGEWRPMRVLEDVSRLKPLDLALVLVRLAVPLAAKVDRTPDRPVGLDRRAEEPLLDRLQVGRRVPDGLGRGVNRRRRGRGVGLARVL